MKIPSLLYFGTFQRRKMLSFSHESAAQNKKCGPIDPYLSNSKTMTDAVQIPLSELQIGRWYVGRGRNSNVGLWDGENFLVVGKGGIMVSRAPTVWEKIWNLKREPYFTKTEGCFQPFKLVDEGIVTEPADGPDSLRYATQVRHCFSEFLVFPPWLTNEFNHLR